MIGSDNRGVPEQGEEPARIGRGDSSAELWVVQCPLELGEQQLGHD